MLKKGWKKIILGFFGGVIIGLVVWFLFLLAQAGNQIFTPNIDGQAPWFLPKIEANKLKGEGDGRINILLLGIGGGKHPGPNLTDTIMLVSIDPTNKKAGLLSIPRDLYLEVPGIGWTKINYVHAYGESNPKTTGGGPALMKQTLSEVLDLPIHYFVRLDFDGFVKLVDAVDGVDIYVEKAISDPYYPAPDMKHYDPFFITAGWHHLDGKTALKYVRSRETTSDFDRSARQQKFLKAFLQKATSLNILSNPKKVSLIISILGNHLKTDFTLGEVQRLLSLAQEINKGEIVTKVLDSSTDGLLVAKSGSQGYYLVPKAGNFREIQRFVHEFLTDPYLARETAKIEVQNGTTQKGLAQEVAQLLKSYGYQVVRITTASSLYPKTTIYDYTGGEKPITLSLLSKRLNAKIIKSQRSSGGNVDLLVILGEDYQESN